MKASELIKKLQERVATLGDLPVEVATGQSNEFYPIKWVIAGSTAEFPEQGEDADDVDRIIIFGKLSTQTAKVQS
jgi:hypothetical protein